MAEVVDGRWWRKHLGWRDEILLRNDFEMVTASALELLQVGQWYLSHITSTHSDAAESSFTSLSKPRSSVSGDHPNSCSIRAHLPLRLIVHLEDLYEILEERGWR